MSHNITFAKYEVGKAGLWLFLSFPLILSFLVVVYLFVPAFIFFTLVLFSFLLFIIVFVNFLLNLAWYPLVSKVVFRWVSPGGLFFSGGRACLLEENEENLTGIWSS